jgi:hypothetical protein
LHLKAALALSAVFGAAAVSAAQGPGQPAASPSLSTVLSRAAVYVERFADRMSGFVMAETYVQDVRPALNRFGARPGFSRTYNGSLHRDLKADLLLVRPIGAEGWMQFRDVTEVDGRPLKDRNDRLARLFLQPSKSTAEQARKIMNESSRYNIGDIERNINLPVLALVVLSRFMQPGFEFALEPPDTKHELPKSGAFALVPNLMVVSFRETELRTMVASPQGKNMASTGRFWIDRETSQIVFTEIGVEDLWLKAVIHVAYAKVDGFDMPAPVEMHEFYENKLNGTLAEGTARYSNFREFKVSVDENIAPINDQGKQDR